MPDADADTGSAGSADSADSAERPLDTFVAIMRRLREECPWKQEQTHRSLARYLLEETHETLEAIDDGDRTGDWGHLREELGDLLLQVVFHAVIAEQSGEFTLDDVAQGIADKMVRRNPHVFGDAQGDQGPMDPVTVNELWQSVKAAEKNLDDLDPRERITAGLPPGLPALLYADKVLDRLARADRPAAPDPGSADLGERLLALVAEARADGVDPEQALRDAVRRLL